MGSYVAIDFETANQHRDSACAVGVVRVDDGEVTDSWTTLIDPEVPFARINTSIHGISESSVRAAPLFPEVLKRITDTLSHADVLVAHSASFDTQVLVRTAERYGLSVSDRWQVACTRIFARRWFPGWPSYALPYCVDRLGLTDALGGQSHHEALWDAAAAMMIAEHGLRERGMPDWDSAALDARVRLGVLGGVGCRAQASGSSTAELTRTSDSEPDPAHPLFGQVVCFTGELQAFSRRDAKIAVLNAGGTAASTVTKRTDMLVVGFHDLSRLRGHEQSAKMRRALELSEQGHPIEILDEREFFRLLDAD